MAHQLPTNILLNPTKNGEEVEIEIGTRNSSLIRLVPTKYDFAREEVTRLVTDQNVTLNIGGGGGGKIHRIQTGRSDRPFQELSWDLRSG